MNTIDSLRETATDCFDMALKQIEHLNPNISLNLARYEYRAYVKDDVLVPPPPTPNDGSLSFEEDELEEQGNDEVGPGAPEAEQSNEVVPFGYAACPS